MLTKKMLPIHNKIKNMFEHSNLTNILVNKKYIYWKKKTHQGRGVTPRQIQLVWVDQ